MRLIALTKGYLAIVDAEDYEYLNQFKWYVSYGYAVRNIQDQQTKKRRIIYMHRLIMNVQKDERTDHINGNKLDNRRPNLRICTIQQNNMNKPKHKDNTSGYKGVYWHKNKWMAYITKDRKMIYIGYYDSKEEAARAYNLKAKELFGEFAYLNKIKELTNGPGLQCT